MLGFGPISSSALGALPVSNVSTVDFVAPSKSVTQAPLNNATAVTICSTALIMLGSKPISRLDEDSKGALVMSAIYDTVRDEMLREHPWNFATRRVMLSPDVEAPAFSYGRQFTLPADCLRVLAIGDCGTAAWNVYGGGRYVRESDVPYQLEGRKILSDRASLPLRYIFANQIEATWDAMFVGVMTVAMAMRACYPVTGSTSLMTTLMQDLALRMKKVRGVDGQENPAGTWGGSEFPLLQGRGGGWR